MTASERLEDETKHRIPKAQTVIEYTKKATKPGQYDTEQKDGNPASTQAAEAIHVTAQDLVAETAGGGRLPAVPVDKVQTLNEQNEQNDQLEDRKDREQLVNTTLREARDGTIHGAGMGNATAQSSQTGAHDGSQRSAEKGASLADSIPPSKTNPLFPPLPVYGSPTLLRGLQSWVFRIVSSVLSLCFLGAIVLGAVFTYVPLMFHFLRFYLRLQHPDTARPFHVEEKRRAAHRRDAAIDWERLKNSKRSRRASKGAGDTDEESRIRGAMRDDSARSPMAHEHFPPTEGGTDRLLCDVAYYARREGLDSETFLVQTEDGFIIELWHIYDPLTYTPREDAARQPHEPELFPKSAAEAVTVNGEGHAQRYPAGSKKYPILLIHGLLQSSGAYCCTGPHSFAFYLAKAGYDVWLGNNRCGFTPRHTMLRYSDPRMWAWNIRQMGVMDLAALISRVLTETGFSKCALIAHSQGTTQTLVALAREQRPELGQRLSVVCFLAPAAYAGPLIEKAYFKFMQVISPSMFRLVFGIHSFIPFMMTMQKYLPGRLYGFMGYRVFSFLFNWTDARWDRGLRNRCFIFAPVYVSSESMRWWLGRECFARQKCILATKKETAIEDQEDYEDDLDVEDGDEPSEGRPANLSGEDGASPEGANLSIPAQQPEPTSVQSEKQADRGRFAWYDETAPPMAFWVPGSDDLVDGRRLLKRFERGREPHVRVVHTKIIESYEHLDVIWAVDSLKQVGQEVGEVIWRTVGDDAKLACREPQLDLPQ